MISSDCLIFSRRSKPSDAPTGVGDDATEVPCLSDAVIPTDSELEAYALSIGMTNEAIYNHLRDQGLGRMEKNGGKVSETFRIQKTIKKTRVEVGYVKFVKMTKLLKSKEDFSWERVASAFKIKAAVLGEFATWMENELWIKHKFDDIATNAVTTSTEKTNALLKDSTCVVEHSQSKHGKQGKDLGVRASFIAACNERNFDAIAIGLGMHPLNLCQSSEVDDEVTLHERFEIEVQRMCSVHSIATTEEFIPLLNLFLLWMHKNDPSLWKSGRDFLITPVLVFKFIKAYVNGQMKLVNGRAPSFASVIRDGIEYEFEKEIQENAIQSKTAYRYVAALGNFQRVQGTLLGLKIEPVMQNNTIKSYLKNLQVEAPSTSQKMILDRHRNVQYADFDVLKKQKESVKYLEKASSCDIRDRSAMLCTTYSVSRYGETKCWDLADCFLFSYNNDLPGVTAQTIDTVYILQHRSKTKSDDMLEDWNLVIRHRDYLQCPAGSLALHLATRFLVDLEPFPNLKGPKDSWYNIKLFQHQNDGTRELKSAGIYTRKRKLMEEAGTKKRSTLHDDRHHGALLAKLFGVPSEDISQLGTWEVTTKSRCYANVHQPLTVIRMSGFLENEQYFLSRNVLDPASVVDHEVEAFTSGIFWQVDDPSWLTEIEKKCNGGPRKSDHASKNVCSLFRFLRKVLVQDLPLMYDRFPDLSIFHCEYFKRHWEGFQRWYRLQSDTIREVEKVRSQKPPELLSVNSRLVGSLVSLSDEAPKGYVIVPILGSEKLGYLRKEEHVSDTPAHASYDEDFLQRLQSTDHSVKALWSLQEQNRTDLMHLTTSMRQEFEALHSAISERRCEEKSILDGRVLSQEWNEDAWSFPTEKTNGPANKPPNEYSFTKLPKLSGMSLKDVYDEWKQGVVENGQRGLPLEEIERLRVEDKVYLRDPRNMGLKSAMEKRRSLIKFIEQRASNEGMDHCRGDVDRVIAKVTSEMDSICGPGWTLNHLYKRIKGYDSKSKN